MCYRSVAQNRKIMGILKHDYYMRDKQCLGTCKHVRGEGIILNEYLTWAMESGRRAYVVSSKQSPVPVGGDKHASRKIAPQLAAVSPSQCVSTSLLPK